jgi:hypothetical protein
MSHLLFIPTSCHRFLNCTTPLNIAPSIIGNSYLPSLTNMLDKAQTRIISKIASSTNYMVVQRHFSTWSPPRSMALIPTKSTFGSPLCQSQYIPSPFPESREEIGVLTSLPLLRKVVEDLEAARNNGGSSITLYFTKESHIHTLVNLVLLSGLPIANRRIPELDYCVRDL